MNSTDVRGKKPAIEQIRAGVDWLTMTLPRAAHEGAWWLGNMLTHLRNEVAPDHIVKQYRLQGYDGWGSGGCFVGEREDGYMGQFSGSFADDAFYQFHRRDAHISRIDLRVDVKYVIMPQTIARKGYRDAIRANEGLPISRRRKIYLLVGSDGGDTLYLGSPTSEQRGRLYNKEVQSEDPIYSRTWRYEVVYRNDTANSIAGVLQSHEADDFDAIKTIVASWYGNRGIHTRHFGTGKIVAVPLVRTIPSDLEKRLVWLRTQVAPALRFIQEAGATNEMLEALGIVVPQEG